MKRALLHLAVSFLPRSFGGRVYTAHEFAHAGGKDKLVLRNVADSLYWRHVLGGRTGAVDFHSLTWESMSTGPWRTVASVTRRAVQRSGDAWVSGIHSLEPTDGVAIVQIGRCYPASAADLPEAALAEMGRNGASIFSAQVARYSWVSLNMRSGKLLSVLKDCKTPFDRHDA
jgi:hypothetical protein